MNRTTLGLAALLALGTIAVSPVSAQVSAVPNSVNFQGRLATSSGNPMPDGTYSIRFSLWDAASAGTEKYSKTIANVQVKNGTFAVTLDAFAANAFNGNLWLEVKIGTDVPLSPRTPLVSVPYAIKSDLALTVPDGSLTASKFASGVLNGTGWLLGGNSGTNPATQFVGTTDAQPLLLKANNLRGLQLQHIVNGNYQGMNVLGGHWENSIAGGVTGATLFGGITFGATNYPNRVTDHGGTVGGGRNNQVGDGDSTVDDAMYATVAGGSINTASGDSSTVGGGGSNTAGNFYSTVAGGFANDATGYSAAVAGGFDNTANGGYAAIGGGTLNGASGSLATVGGGYSNLASGAYSTVAGGYDNTAAGDYSFAGGRLARANHAGSFVWADSNNANWNSTGPNQFSIRATGGVVINAGSPAGYTFYVNGTSFLGGNTYINGTARTTNLNVDGSLVVDGKLTVTDIPFGDYRNVQVHGVTGQFYYDNSSRKHKRNITPLVDDFDKLLQAVPMTYTRPAAPDRWEIGFIAEEFDALGLKKLVDYGKNGEVEGINYEKICLYLTAIAKKQNHRLATQEKDNAAKDAQIAELRAELDALKAAVRELQNNRK